MSAQNAVELKEKMISLFNQKGPSLPVHIAKETGLSILFASAFLSELIAEKKLKISSMRIGNSPLYFLSGQEPMLENFSEYLKGKEREAFLFLKEKKFLVDSETEPALRVALREIRDFAIPFKIDEKVYWRYFTENESEFIDMKFRESESPKIFHKIQVVEKRPELVEGMPDISDVVKEELPEKEKKHPKTRPKKISSKKRKSRENEKFLEIVKEFLSKSSTEIISIEGFKKDELLLRVKIGKDEQLLAAYNKRKISEKEIIKAGKKASELGLKYSLLSLGELPKKISDLIEALKEIKDIEKIE